MALFSQPCRDCSDPRVIAPPAAPPPQPMPLLPRTTCACCKTHSSLRCGRLVRMGGRVGLPRAEHPVSGWMRWGLVPGHGLCSCILCSDQHTPAHPTPKYPENHWEGKYFGIMFWKRLQGECSRNMATAQSAGSEVCPPGQRHREPRLQEESPKPAAADARAKAKRRSELVALHLASATKEVISRNNHTRAAARLGVEQVLSTPACRTGGRPPSRGAVIAKKGDECKKAL